MKTRINLWIQVTVLLSLAVLCLHYYFKVELRLDGTEYSIIQNYLSPSFQTATFIGGGLLLILGIFLLLTQKIPASCGHDHSSEDSCDDTHQHGDIHPIVAVLILGIPILFSITHTQHQFSERELTRRTEVDINPETFQNTADVPPSFSRATLDQYLQKNENGAYRLGMFELFTTANDPEVSRAIDGVTVEVEAAVRSMPGDESNPKLKRAYRLMMQCCAADMQAIPMTMKLTDAMAANFTFPEHTWLKIEAQLNYERDSKGQQQAVLTAHNMVPSERPDDEILLSDYNPSIEELETHAEHESD
ncbi:hypothetical protein ACFPK9_14375 [Rubritalea spongiae]|uniref:DUF1980 domain-containing protein n=1 Tax=Rubritalea spongiae TaxID=430797 RepID=A0ABW5E8N6_9BACT